MLGASVSALPVLCTPLTTATFCMAAPPQPFPPSPPPSSGQLHHRHVWGAVRHDIGNVSVESTLWSVINVYYQVSIVGHPLKNASYCADWMPACRPSCPPTSLWQWVSQMPRLAKSPSVVNQVHVLLDASRHYVARLEGDRNCRWSAEVPNPL